MELVLLVCLLFCIMDNPLYYFFRISIHTYISRPEALDTNPSDIRSVFFALEEQWFLFIDTWVIMVYYVYIVHDMHSITRVLT